MVLEFSVNVDLDTAVTRTVPAFKAPFKGKLRAASYLQEADAAGATMTVKLRNATKAVDLTADLDVAALGALAGADFVLSTTEANKIVNKGDLVTVVLTATTGTTGPSETSITVAFEFIND